MKRDFLGAAGFAMLAFGVMSGAGQAQDFDGVAATDIDLEWVVYSAYNGARDYAIAHDNYFMWSSKEFPALRDAIIEGLEAEGYDAAIVGSKPATSIGAAIACGDEGQTELRVRLNSDGGGIILVAVTAERMAAYEYDPDKSADIIITAPQDCDTELALVTGDKPSDDTATGSDADMDEQTPDKGGETGDIVDIVPGDDATTTDETPADDAPEDTVGKTKNKG